MQAQAALDTAAAIADHLCALAYSYQGQATWFAPTPRDDETLDPPSWVNLGPQLYDGSSGIALFLGEVFTRTDDERHRDMALGAMMHALGKLESVTGYTRFGLHDGALGVAHVAARLAWLLDRPDLDRRARDVVQRVVQDLQPPFALDVISGAAGAIPVLLTLSHRPTWPDLVPPAVRLGDAILAAASREDIGWSWAAAEFTRNLTGFSHGAAGIGWSLVKLYEHTHEARFLEAAMAAFRYEDHWFDPGENNWPDFRWDPDPPAFVVAWCHGAVGIGLSRLAALQVCQDERLKQDAEAAVRASKRHLTDPDAAPDADFCLCHGRAGIATFLLRAGELLADRESRDIAVATAEAAAESYSDTPGEWPTNGPLGRSPTLMTGLAGVGYFYLGLADPELPCLLQLS